MTPRAAGGALAIVWALTIAASAGAAPLVVRARPGIAGAVRPGKLAPVVVDVDSTTASGPAVVRYEVGERRWTRQIELAPGTRKRCVLLADTFNRSARISVCEPGGEALATEDVAYPDVLADGTLYTLVVARAEQHHAPAALNGLAVERGPGLDAFRNEVRFARAADLPEHWAALAAVDAVVVADDDLDRAATGGLGALLEWTARGGSLFVIGGVQPSRLAGTALAPVLPVELTGRTVQLDRLEALDAAFPGGTAASIGGAGLPLASTEGIRVREPFVVPEARVRAGARALVVERGPNGPVPVLARRPLGDGSVTYLALDLERSPFSYTGRVAQLRMWRSLLPRPSRPSDQRYDPHDGQRHELANGRVRLESAALALSGEATSRRAPWMVTFFVVAYWLVVGPGQYLVLRRKKALHLVWVITPVIAVLFSLAAFGLGYLRRGASTVGREIMVVSARAGDPVAVADALVRIHAFKEVGYTVRGAAGASLAMPLNVENGEQLTVGTLGPEVAALGVTVPMWSERTFHLTQAAPAPDVSAELEVVADAGTPGASAGSGARVKGTITVRGTRMVAARLQLAGHHCQLGDLEPGRPHAVDERLTIQTPDPDEHGYRGHRRPRARPSPLRQLPTNAEWWVDLGAAWSEPRLELVGFVDTQLFPGARVEPPVGAYERAVLACVTLPYRPSGAQEVTVAPGRSHRRTLKDPDLSLGQVALSAPLVYETRLFTFPRPGLTVRELALILPRDERIGANVWLKHPFTGTWVQIYKAGSAVPSGHWRDRTTRVEITNGSEYVRMPEGLLDVKLEPSGGALAPGAVGRVDFEVRGTETDWEVGP